MPAPTDEAYLDQELVANKETYATRLAQDPGSITTEVLALGVMKDALDEYVEGKKQLIDARYHRIVARDGPPKHKHERVGYLELAATKVVGDQLKGRDFGGKVDPDAAEKLVVKELEFVTRK